MGIWLVSFNFSIHLFPILQLKMSDLMRTIQIGELGYLGNWACKNVVYLTVFFLSIPSPLDTCLTYCMPTHFEKCFDPIPLLFFPHLIYCHVEIPTYYNFSFAILNFSSQSDLFNLFEEIFNIFFLLSWV